MIQHANIAHMLVPGALSFLIGIIMAPILAHFLYKNKAWKKKAGKQSLDGTPATEFNRLHLHNEIRAPRMGGVLIWASVILSAVFTYLLSQIYSYDGVSSPNFFSRSETLLPFAAMIVGAIVGLMDDMLMIGPSGDGLRLRTRLGVVLILSGIIGWWFYFKLGVQAIAFPFVGSLFLGWWIIPLFIFVALGLYASGVIDGIDGLAGGVFASVYASYAIIAFSLGQYDLSAFCASVVGGTLAFLWFNVPPARFYMSDTGCMALTLALSIVVFLTDSIGGGVGVMVLPVIGFILVITVLSNVAQVLAKRYLGRKILRVAPLHHHFEAIGWSAAKVTMRYWIASVMLAIFGVLMALATQ